LERLKSRLKANTDAEESLSDGVLVLKVANSTPGNTKMDIGYLAENVFWEPFYEVKGMKLMI
jgi:hypothetical protein